jgi:maleate cis-trans isomerase
MAEAQTVHIGVLSPATPNRPHFKSLDAILPADVSIAHEGLGLLGESYQDLAGKTERIVEVAQDFARRHQVRGLMITGGFVTLFNPGLEAKVADAVGLPVVSAVSSAVAALKTFTARTVLLMTPFDAASDGLIKAHLDNLGFTVHLGPSFENRKAGAAVDLSRDALFELVEKTFRANPDAEAIYFQGATMDPLPILQRLEDAFAVPVITSNSAMVWNLLSKLGHRFSVRDYGKLLQDWPASKT